jgi:hypothetical protein
VVDHCAGEAFVTEHQPDSFFQLVLSDLAELGQPLHRRGDDEAEEEEDEGEPERDFEDGTTEIDGHAASRAEQLLGGTNLWTDLSIRKNTEVRRVVAAWIP